MCETEVFVAGGGPAGLAAAIACRQAGFAVTLADSAKPPIDKACGEGIMPDGVAHLKRLGVSLCPSTVARFEGIRFIDAAGTVGARFPQGGGFGVRRTVLHQRLLDRATETGVAMHWGVRISHVSGSDVTINGQKVRARWLVCADGQNSQLRKLAGLNHSSGSVRQRFGFRRHYRIEPWSDFVEVYWSDRGQMYVTPVGADEVCIALITRYQGLRFDDALPLFPFLAKRIAERPIISRTMGSMTVTRKLKAVQHGCVALIGEASGSVDAITGEGLSLAFQQSVSLAEAMRGEQLACYQKAHRRIAGLPGMMARLMLTMDDHPSFRKRVFRALDAQPELFAHLLALHTGAQSPLEFGLRNTLSLGWQLLTA
jgi:menaquinone-9 beta-reductase